MSEEVVRSYESKLSKNGNGSFLSVPSYVIKYLNLEKGDKFEVNMKKLKEINKNGLTVRNAENFQFLGEVEEN